MKAIVLHEYGPASILTYEDVEDPKPAEGEVLVRVSATSINPADWMIRSGAVKDILPVEFPYILGCDLAGTICEIGKGVTGFEPGDRVMAVALHTYAELCVVNTAELVKIPAGLEMTTAAALPLVNVTGDSLIRLGTNVQPGQTVLITGALGSVGRSAVFAASQIGARVIAGVRGKRLDAARQLPGVEEAIAIDDDAEIDKLAPLDCVADIVGGELADKLLARVKEGGTFACFPKRNPQNAALYPTVHITTIFGQVADTTRAAQILHYAEAVRDGKLTIPIERIMPLAAAAEAQKIAEKGGVAKIILAV
ncbi:NADP-dependent oxidoreductase [Ktedonosporobacter rubrisoli]|uniref:NADP-dependent oxidoreductase n=1 Tax=Ktedonosporobacter rubrisoli TaxID=2509675 RepID=A0A4P6JI42_KTERU|nr:NADP-dependent oxidoreductase [Ktedonosporobacter rubrisoli]QBD74623.1 NADP-dependent oxidoreductase [Ktedonosporobacter rubrisoli]